MEKLVDWVSENKVLAAAIVVAAIGGGYAVYSYGNGQLPIPKLQKDASKQSKQLPQHASPTNTPKKSSHEESIANTPATHDPNMSKQFAEAIQLKVGGNEEFKKKQYQKAYELYTQAIELYTLDDEERSKMLHNRGRSSFFLKKNDEAIADFTAAMKINPTYAKCIKHRIECFEVAKDERGILRDMMKLAVLNPKDDCPESAKVQALLEKLGKEQADDILETREPVMPSDSVIEPFFNGFGTRFTKPDVTESVEELTTMIEGSPENPELYYKRALAYLAKKEYGSIYDDAEKAVTLYKGLKSPTPEEKKNLVEALSFKGLLQNLRGKFSLALDEWNEALSLDNNHAMTFLRRATAYEEQLGPNSHQLAKNDITKAAKIAPADPAIKYFQAQVAMTENALDAASSLLDDAISLGHGGYMPYLQKTLTLLGKSHTSKEAAIKELDVVFKETDKLFPKEVMCFVYRAQVLLSKAKFAEADILLDAAIRIHKNNPLPYANKGLNCLLWVNSVDPRDASNADKIKEKIEDGIKWLEKAVEIDPKFDMAHNHLAGVAMQRGLFEKAISHYDKIIRYSHAAKEVTTSCQYKEAALAQLENEKEGFRLPQAK